MGERGPNFPLLSSCFWSVLRGLVFNGPNHRQGQPVREAFPWGNKQGIPCGKAPPGGTEGCARAGSIPQGEQARCTVWKDSPWGNKQGVPCGKAPPRGTGWCACMGSIPLGEQARCTVWRKSPWGNKPRYTCAVSAPLGEQKRFPWGSGQGARSGRSQEKIKKKSRNNICTHRCSFTSPRPSHISCSDSATSYASFILQQLELAQTKLQVEVHQPITTVLTAPKSTIKVTST